MTTMPTDAQARLVYSSPQKTKVLIYRKGERTGYGYSAGMDRLAGIRGWQSVMTDCFDNQESHSLIFKLARLLCVRQRGSPPR
jgi:hypothetical protein